MEFVWSEIASTPKIVMQDNQKLKVSEELNHPDRNCDTLQKSQSLNR